MPASHPDRHPPRPRLTVRVAVTGHRWDKLRAEDAPAIRERLDLAFAEIERIVGEIHELPQAGYRGDPRDGPTPAPVFRILSGLAEGTDRLAAQVALSRPRRWELTAVLPYPRAAYLADFTVQIADGTGPAARFPNPDSVEEFEELIRAASRGGGVQELDGNPARPMHREAYRELGRTLCLNSDILIAVWDDLAAKPGGTGEVVDRAVELGIPIIRVPVDGVCNPWLNGDDRHSGAGLAALAPQLQRTILAPREHERASPDEEYFAETAQPDTGSRLYAWFMDRIAPLEPPADAPRPRAAGRDSDDASEADDPADPELVKALRRRWDAEWRGVGVCAGLRAALWRTGIHRHYAWASNLANYYGGRYRSYFLVNYLLSVLAVAAAAVGVVVHQFPGSVAAIVPPLAGLGEIVLLILIAKNVGKGRGLRLHERWLDYRRLAEWIRLLPMLLPLGRTPVLGLDRNPVLAQRESWVDWMFRAVLREAGLLPVNLADHRAGAHGILSRAMLEGQIRYHGRAADRNARANERLHRLTITTFKAALAIAVLHWIFLIAAIAREDWAWLHVVVAVLVVPTLVLPALGAVLHGIRSQGDFEMTADRSAKIRTRLEQLVGELIRTQPSVANLATIATQTTAVMSAELSAWLIAYQRKELTLT